MVKALEIRASSSSLVFYRKVALRKNGGHSFLSKCYLQDCFWSLISMDTVTFAVCLYPLTGLGVVFPSIFCWHVIFVFPSIICWHVIYTYLNLFLPRNICLLFFIFFCFLLIWLYGRQKNVYV